MYFLKTLTLLALVSIASDSFASPSPKCFRKKKTLAVWSFSGKMEDSYIKLRRGNYFQLYSRIMGLTKTGEYTGTYTQSGDTLFFHFCGGKLPDHLAGYAVLGDGGKTLTVVDTRESFYSLKYDIRKDRRPAETSR